MLAIDFTNNVSFQEKVFFTKHLAVMLKSGINIVEALKVLVDQTPSAGLKKVLNNVVADVKNGQSLAKALEKHPHVFDNFYINLVKVSEESGTLDEGLSFLSKQLAKDYSLRQKIKTAMLYPGLIFTATIIMGGFISLFILPQLVDFFSSFDVELPMATKILLYFANLMKNHGMAILGGFCIFSILIYFFIRLPFILPLWHRMILNIPLIGKVILYGQLAGFSRNLGVLIKSGLSITNSIETTAKTLNNITYVRALTFAQEQVTKGKSLASVLESFPKKIFPGLVVKMVAVGEKSGSLEESLMYLGDFYEEEIDNISKNLTTILEPILLIFIGLVVGFVAIAIISPIYELTGSIRR